MAFHTETRIGARLNLYHHDSDINHQNKETNKMELENKVSTNDRTEDTTSNSNPLLTLGALLLAGILMVTLVG
jgi:hypothetical protein